MVGLLAAVLSPPAYDIQTAQIGIASGFNDSGLVVGGAPAVQWDGNEIKEFPKPFQYADQLRISADGTVFAHLLASGRDGYDVVRMTKGRITYLPRLGKTETGDVYAISPSGIAAGSCGGTYSCKPTYWTSGNVRELGLLLGDTYGEALGVNDAGVIVGTSTSLNGKLHPVIYRDLEAETIPTPTPLRLPSRMTSGRPMAINSKSVVVGWTSGKHSSATLWREDNVELLQKLPDFSESVAMDINDSGDVVGSNSPPIPIVDGPITPPYYEARATLWRNGVVYDLNQILRKQQPRLRLLRAMGINNRGQIFGEAWTGKDFRTFLLTPATR